jgi:flagellar L-ring protein precursor FlgH
MIEPVDRHWMGRGLILGVTALLAAGCAQVPHDSVVDEPEELELSEPARPEPNGAIYQAGMGSTSWFEDRRPTMAGDVLTIVLDEEVSASKSSESNANRDGSASLDLETLPDALETLAEYGFDIEGASEFTGGGGSEANNSFTGTITVTVMEVLRNGNLRVRGEKQIAINQGTEFIRFSGVVDPRTIDGQGTVPSTQVAEARIEYVGDGYINEAQTMGWLQRFFLNVSPF